MSVIRWRRVDGAGVVRSHCGRWRISRARYGYNVYRDGVKVTNAYPQSWAKAIAAKVEKVS